MYDSCFDQEFLYVLGAKATTTFYVLAVVNYFFVELMG